MKSMLKFRTTRNRINVVTREVADCSAILYHLDAHKVPHYMFHPKSKPVKAVIHWGHLC